MGIQNLKSFFTSNFIGKSIFILTLFLVVFTYIRVNIDNDISHISSDVWLYSFSYIQEQENIWQGVPEVYIKEPFYLAYHVLNWATAGWNEGVWRFHLLAIIILCSTYLVNGLVIFAFTKKWWVATLAGVLLVLPHNIFSTQIGALGFDNVRGVGFVFPLYLLLSFYWIHFGIEKYYQNLLLAFVAGLSVYLYPPVGIIIIPLFILTAAIVRGKNYWFKIFIFSAVYLLTSSLFWYGHFSVDHTGMLDQVSSLSQEQSLLQIEILKDRFHGSVFDIDFGKFKRSVWDGLPIIVVFFMSLWFVKIKHSEIWLPLKRFSYISVVFLVMMIIFVVGVEIINQILIYNHRPAFFIEHVRLLRALGFIMISQSVLGVYLMSVYVKKTWLVILVSGVLLVSPLWVSASAVRFAVRMVVPISIREEYNLAPVQSVSQVKSFSNLQLSALWVDRTLAKTDKIFLFNDSQQEFIFKVLSKRDTNMTVKEGSVWVTSGFDNSVRWYEERMQYKKIVENATNFSDILDFAKSLKMTHMLIPRGKYEDLFISSGLDLKTIYQNYDYRLIVI